MSIIRISETLKLNGIDPVILLKDYLNGNYKSLTIPIGKTQISKTFITLGHKMGTDHSSEIYKFSDKSNNSQVVVTTNHSLYNSIKERKELPISKCLWCRRKIKNNPIGIPVYMERNSENGQCFFHTDGTYDSFNCAYADLKRNIGVNYIYRDALYMDSEQMLYCMYYSMHPNKEGKKIEEAPDWRLLRKNGGPLSDEEYDSEINLYVSTPNIVMLPSKRQFLRLNIKK